MFGNNFCINHIKINSLFKIQNVKLNKIKSLIKLSKMEMNIKYDK